jgi:predicted transcriptional regulator
VRKVTDDKRLIELTADIVSAHASNNQVPVGDVGRLIQLVHAGLSGLATGTVGAPANKTPATSIRSSIKPDHLVCLECGRNQKMLKLHLRTAHALTPEQYRQDFQLPIMYPMIAADYANHRRELAKSIGRGRNRAGQAQPKRGASNGKGGSDQSGE